PPPPRSPSPARGTPRLAARAVAGGMGQLARGVRPRLAAGGRVPSRGVDRRVAGPRLAAPARSQRTAAARGRGGPPHRLHGEPGRLPPPGVSVPTDRESAVHGLGVRVAPDLPSRLPPELHVSRVPGADAPPSPPLRRPSAWPRARLLRRRGHRGRGRHLGRL